MRIMNNKINYFFIFALFFSLIIFSSFVFSIGVSPETLMVEMNRDEIFSEEIIIYNSGELIVDGETDFVYFNLTKCDKYCIGYVVVDARYISPDQYREELFFYDNIDGNINSGVRLPIIVDIKSTDFSLIQRVKDDKVIIGFFSGIIFLIVVLGLFVFRK